MVRAKAKEKLEWHRGQGHKIVIVSASPKNWVMPWCQASGYDCIATILNVSQGSITGKIEGYNCYGQTKVELIRKTYDLSKYHEVYAYGDSSGDLQMLKLADKPSYKPFR